MPQPLPTLVLDSILHRFRALKEMGDRTLAQLGEEDLLWQFSPETNSIAVTVQHLHGNMRSRWTGFLNSDGEKDWRDRDGEFTQPVEADKARLLELWEEGWRCCLGALEALTGDDLARTVTIRGEELTVIDAINRQLSHYSYHMGQIVQVAKKRLGERWQTLSIPRGESRAYRPWKRD